MLHKVFMVNILRPASLIYSLFQIWKSLGLRTSSSDSSDEESSDSSDASTSIATTDEQSIAAEYSVSKV